MVDISLKIRGRGCTISRSLSLSYFSFFLHNASTKHYTPTYIYLCYLFVWCSLHWQTRRVFLPFLCFASFLRFSALCGFIFAFGAFLVSFSSFLNRPTPPHFHGTESVATPFLNFLFFSFSKIFCWKKRGMIYLHFVCVYVGTEYLHFRCCLCVVGLVFTVGWLCVVGWLCRVLNLYKLNISS